MRSEYMVAVSDVRGMSFRFKTEDAVGRHIYKLGSYEETMTDWLECTVRLGAGDVALDVGANIGWYAVLLAKLSDPATQVFAFEPDPLNFSLLVDNLARNGASTVKPVQKAAGAIAGRLHLHQYGAKNLGRHSLLPINEGTSVEVEVLSLDAFLAAEGIDLARVRFLKMDVEGFELSVLEGMPKLLAANPLIIAEYSPATMRRCGLDVGRMLGLLRDAGYLGHRLVAGALKPVAPGVLEALDHTVNLVWKRP